MSDTPSDSAFFSPEAGAGADWEYRFCEGAAAGRILQEEAAESTTVSAEEAGLVWVAEEEVRCIPALAWAVGYVPTPALGAAGAVSPVWVAAYRLVPASAG